MQAINYKKLLREERKRLKNETKKPSDTKAKEKDKNANLHRPKKDRSVGTPSNRNSLNWDYDVGFLAFRKLSLHTICENPPLISYSSSALGEHEEQKRNSANKSESLSPEKALTNWLQRIPSGNSGQGEWKTMTFGKRRVCMFGEDELPLPPPLEEMANELVKQGIFPSSSPPNHVLLNEYQPGQGILPHTDGPLYKDCTATLSLTSDVVIEFTKRLSSNEIGQGKTVCVANSVTNNCKETNEYNNNNYPIDDKDGIAEKKTNSLDKHSLTVLLESGSLLVFRGEAYTNYCHGIEMDAWQDVTTEKCQNASSGRIVPRSLRYSLTFRHRKKEIRHRKKEIE